VTNKIQIFYNHELTIKEKGLREKPFFSRKEDEY